MWFTNNVGYQLRLFRGKLKEQTVKEQGARSAAGQWTRLTGNLAAYLVSANNDAYVFELVLMWHFIVYSRFLCT